MSLPHCLDGKATWSVATRGVSATHRTRCVPVSRPARGRHEREAVMKIAVAGKGGSGKTTLAGTLARVLGHRGQVVLAIDADTNPNLAVTLGLPREAAAHLQPVPPDIMAEQ